MTESNVTGKVFMDGKSESTASPEQKAQLEALNYVYVLYADRIERWIKANGQTPPPFRWDKELQEFIWVNRAQRRAWK